MRNVVTRNSILIAFCILALLASGSPAQTAVNVTEYHNHDSRDGLYVDPTFTRAAAANLKRDLSFNGSISGNVYAQPLYIENGPGGKPMIIAVTESDNAYALDADDGSIIWQTNLGTPVPRSSLPCGNIDPLGITGTPIVDIPSRTLLLDAMTTPDSGATKQHLLYSLNVDTGAVNSGWPVSLNEFTSFNGTPFSSDVQNQRSALALLNGVVYASYGGHAGDCGSYHAWIIGVPLDAPGAVTSWASTATGCGSWSVGGIASDETNLFIATGNSKGASTWSGGEAIIRFQPGPLFSGATVDYWAATNWLSLDSSDLDLGGSGPLLVDVPGATPSALVVALGKDGNAYLLNRTNLGGVTTPLTQSHVSSTEIAQAAATYRTTQGTYIVFSGNSSQSQLTALRIGATQPPSITSVWTVSEGGRGSPFVTSTDGTNNMIVWGLGAEGDQRLHGFDGDTGSVIFNGGGANELMANTRHFSTAIAARGRIYVGTDSRIYAFTLPASQIILGEPTLLPDGSFQFGFTNTPGMSFTAYSCTNLLSPFSNWTDLGSVPEISPGQFQFTDTPSANSPILFFRVTSP
jgi:outer membrane protein assembly factor BamB